MNNAQFTTVPQLPRTKIFHSHEEKSCQDTKHKQLQSMFCNEHWRCKDHESCPLSFCINGTQAPSNRVSRRKELRQACFIHGFVRSKVSLCQKWGQLVPWLHQGEGELHLNGQPTWMRTDWKQQESNFPWVPNVAKCSRMADCSNRAISGLSPGSQIPKVRLWRDRLETEHTDTKILNRKAKLSSQFNTR